jgi:lipid A ethanolaminephosphotransferase
MHRPTLSPLGLTASASVWMATAANLPLWRELRALGLLDSVADGLFAAALAVVMAAALVCLLSLLAWRRTLKPAIVLLLVVSAAASYFMWTYRIVIDSDMVVNVLLTDPNEAAALMNASLLAAFLVLALLPALLVLWVRTSSRGPLVQAARNVGSASTALLLVLVVVVAAFQPLSSAMRNHKHLRYLLNPLNVVYAVGHAVSKPLRRDGSVMEPVGLDAVAPLPAAKPPLLVLVLGETARSANFSLNGYGRPTNPELERAGVASFRHATSCGTSTAASVPCMFSHLGRERFDARPHEFENLLDVLQRAGLAVLWLDNQPGGCKGVCDRVPHASTAGQTDPELCIDGACFDSILLQGLDQRLADLPGPRRARGVVIVMHQMGSHGPAYHQRVPSSFKHFLPECTTNKLQDCSREQLANAYDNSIAYTDHVLASTITWLAEHQQDYEPALVYVSDHGESLGEGNLYLHGLPYAIAPDQQKNVPWITWLSAGSARRTGIDLACLRRHADQPVSHDDFFHSVLGLLQIRTSAYVPEHDAYAPCRASAPPVEPLRVRTPNGVHDDAGRAGDFS